MHLRDNYTLCSVDHESALSGHQWHVSHVDILLFYIADRTRAGFLSMSQTTRRNVTFKGAA